MYSEMCKLLADYIGWQ